MDDFKYIIIEGLIKSEKTKLAERLADKFAARLVLDNKENPFINDFYGAVDNPENSYALKTQLIFLLNRFAQQQEIGQKGLFQKLTISDYIFQRDGIYAHTVLNFADLEIYKKLFSILCQNVVEADLVIYLQISFPEMLKRIQERGTEAEKHVPDKFWREIYESYNYYFFNYKSSPLLVVNTEMISLDQDADLENLIAEIKDHKKGIRYYAPG